MRLSISRVAVKLNTRVRRMISLVSQWRKARTEVISVFGASSIGNSAECVALTQDDPIKLKSVRAPLALAQKATLRRAFRLLLDRFPDLADYKPLIENNEILAFWNKLANDYRFGISERDEIRDALLHALSDKSSKP